MNIQEFKEAIGQEAEIIISKGLSMEQVNGKNYKCINRIIHKQNDKHPSMSWDPKLLQFFCFTCGENIDIYRYYKEFVGMTHKEIMELKDPGSTITNIKPKSAELNAAPQLLKNHTDDIINIYKQQTSEDKQYFINRGISEAIIDKYMLCVTDIKQLNDKYYGKRAIIPIWQNGQVVYWNSRDLNETSNCKYLKATGEATFLNIDYLKELGSTDTIIVSEGEFDALSLESIGVKSVAIGGVVNFEKLKKLNTNNINLLTAFDNDKAGQAVESKYKIKIPTTYKDLNEWIQADHDNFEKSIKKQVKSLEGVIKRPDTISQYINSAFIDDIEKFKSYKDIKTGFDNLDHVMGGLYAGLYVVGGISSVGKTTFIHQMADQLAELGQHIVYFSLEQSRLELASKSLSRITAKITDNPVKSIDIRTGNITNEVLVAAKKYEHIADRVSVIEGNFNTDVAFMREYIEKYIKANEIKPIVIIDYLQIIQGDVRMSDKQKIDNIVTELKRMSRDNNITVIVISSLNRGNYLTPVDFESFKESGGIEYTADVVWGVQLSILHDELFEKEGKVKLKRETIKNAKAADPRKIELVCLKNRNGISNYSCNFKYNPKYDLFEPDYLTNDDYNSKYRYSKSSSSRL